MPQAFIRRARSVTLTLATLGSIVALGACAESAVVISASTTRSDSAGVLVITLEDRLSAYPLLTASDSITMHGAPEDLFANNPQAVLPLRDGRTLLSDNRLVASFDSSGAFADVVMKTGRGPGEIFWLAGMWQTGDDSLWVIDASAMRMSRLSPQLGFVSSTAYPRFGERRISLWGGIAGDTLAVSESTYDPNDRTPGLYPTSARLGTWVIGATAPTVGEPRVFGMSQRFQDGVLPAGFSIGQPYSASGQWRSYGRCMIYGYAERWEFDVHAVEASGQFTTVARLRAPRDSAPPITPELREAYIQRNVAGMPENGEIPRVQFEKALRDHATFPARLPSFGRVLVSADGAVWVQRYRESVEHESDQWTIIDLHGTRTWRLELPIGTRLLSVRPQGAFIATRDADEVETQRWLVFPELADLRPIPACRASN